eukprot:TRINITY_DN15042_c0_g1::TRINITY_DN15042_c0_g1_i1::g.24997::m.24997 TRINITY_DN15042_c0_g1::TRINITY_DN15042_c0_g1_i1::g.24997  ORF type:complete len:807 (-),score=163.31,sp/Q921L5/COG2_MOUSE/25.83/1e-61,COG2/PF06148.6/5.1e-32,COG2/PF06148.6/4.1e+03,DUF3510/PF12022.3/1.7e+03,DUF3510/PF12022.3/1.2e+03,DUF3510/PF12022.3/8.2e-19,FlaC_arch/PF05377.6/0.71,FlaC_arch/PF05377.6/7.5e+03,FlaC_arch/PF05377.6/2.1e+03 TRINITY_DN15042_c0_g1_i1:201-2621(-)
MEKRRALCFNPDDLLQESFDPRSFVKALRRAGVPLHALRTDLAEHLNFLHNALIDLLNRDYDDFVNLSTNLAGVESYIEEIRKPLLSVKEQVTRVKSILECAVQEIEGKLHERQQIIDRKNNLQTMIEVSNSLTKIEALLRITHLSESTGRKEDSKSSNNDEPDEEIDLGPVVDVSLSDNEDQKSEPADTSLKTSNLFAAYRAATDTRLLERVAAEYNQLVFHSTKGKDFLFVQSVKPRIDSLGQNIRSRLAVAFEKALTDRDSDSLLHILRSYVTINSVQEVESFYRETFIRPLARQWITEKKLLNAACSDVENLSNMYAEVIAYTTTESFQQLVQLINDHPTLHKIDFITNSLWTEVASLITDRLGKHLFLPGSPTFLAKYNVTLGLMDSLESALGHADRGDAFRDSDTTRWFLTKWQLNIFAQLRIMDITQEMEGSLAASSTPSPSGTAPPPMTHTGFVFPQTEATWHALQRCWHADVAVAPIYHRLFRLCLQIISRYATWVSGGLVDTPPAGSWAYPPENKSRLEVYLWVCSDIRKLCDMLEKDYTPTVTQHLLPRASLVDSAEQGKDATGASAGASGASGAVRAALQAGVGRVRALLDAVLDGGVEIVQKECAHTLQGLKGVMRTYHMTKKEAPRKASLYVPEVLKPLARALTAHSALLDTDRDKFSRLVVERVIAKFILEVREVKDRVAKTTEALKKMKIYTQATEGASPADGGATEGDTGAAGTGTATAGENITSSGGVSTAKRELTDADKIAMQLYFDTVELASQINKLLGCRADTLAGYLELWDLVKSTESLIAQQN